MIVPFWKHAKKKKKTIFVVESDPFYLKNTKISLCIEARAHEHKLLSFLQIKIHDFAQVDYPKKVQIGRAIWVLSSFFQLYRKPFFAVHTFVKRAKLKYTKKTFSFSFILHSINLVRGRAQIKWASTFSFVWCEELFWYSPVSVMRLLF